MAYVPPHRCKKEKESQDTNEKQVEIPTVFLTEDFKDPEGTLWQGLCSTGFALVAAPDVLSPDLCEEAISECKRLMRTKTKHELGVNKVTNTLHKGFRKSDYKDSLMLRLPNVEKNEILRELWSALQVVKYRILKVLEEHLKGLNLCSIHKSETDSMRLLHYPAIHNDATAKLMNGGNRCYAHVDYGTITLLLTDKAGLEVSTGNTWIAVPYKPATVAVNVGRELADDMSNGQLKAAVHRVPGPRSTGSLLADRSSERYSIAIFVQKQLFSDSAGVGKKRPKGNSVDV